MKNNKIQTIKFVCDFLPLLVFFIIYKTSTQNTPIIYATCGLIITTFVTLIICYALTKQIAAMPLFSAAILGLFGLLTIVSGNEIFIKIKPTLLNVLFAIILLFGYFSKKPFLKNLLGSAFNFSDKAWLELSKRWALFFIFLAILNEIVWRNYSTDIWVGFKVFGILPISIIFTCLQIPYIIKETSSQEENAK